MPRQSLPSKLAKQRGPKKGAKKAKATQRPKAGTSHVVASVRRTIFVESILANGGNATQAAIQAGYSSRTAGQAGFRLLKDVEIQDAIARRRAELANRYKLTTDDVLRECARIVYSDPRRLFDARGGLRPVKDLEDEVAATIASIEVSDDVVGKGEDAVSVRTTKVKLWDKNAAIDKAMRYLGLFEKDNAQQGAFAALIDKLSPAELAQFEAAAKELLGALTGNAGGAPEATAPRA